MAKECPEVFRLPENYVVRKCLSIPVSVIVVAAVLGVLIYIFPATFNRPLSYGVALCLILYDVLGSTWLAQRSKAHTSIVLDTWGMSIFRGKIFKKKSSIPYTKISVIRQYSTPLESKLRQGRITVVSASKEIGLPPLSIDDCARLTQLLEEKYGAKRHKA